MVRSFDCRLQTPFNLLITGPTKSGKTTFTCNLLKVSNEMFEKKPDYVILFYAIEQPKYTHMIEKGYIDEMIKIQDYDINFNDLQTKLEPYKNGNGSLIIFDDIMSEISKEFEKIFTTLGHHINASLIFLSQNIFYNNKTYRNMSLNLQYIAVMKNRRDLTQIQYLARQLCPIDPKYVENAYIKAANIPFSYIFFDCTSSAPDELQCRSHLFPFENSLQPYTVYIRNKT